VSDYPSTDALIGMSLGSCRIERLLGAGGMSAIFLAQQERPRRLVAVKVLRPHALADARQWPLFLARFRREADATAALDHANIVPIYEFGEQDDLAYLVMPYLPNGSLAELLTREGPLPITQALSYVDQIASALDYAHQHGIVHRDVKPSNILLHPDGRLLLADFGIARPLDQRDLPDVTLARPADDAGLTIGGVTLGTPDYMSPEQIRGERVGPAADIYALGVVTYATLTGRAPFGGGPTTQVLARQLSDPPPPLRYVRPDAPARMEEAIFWALAKDADERPATAGAFAQALRDGARSSLGALWQRVSGPGPSLASFRGAAESLAPQSPAYGAMAPAAGDATLWDPSYHAAQANQAWSGHSGGAGGGAGGPAWPGARAGSGGNGRQRGIPAPLMAAVALALVVLIVMAIVVASALGNGLGSIFSGGGGALFSHTATPAPTATATMTPSPTPSPTPAPPQNWLSVRPDSLNLGCHKNNKTQEVQLTNNGNEPLGWQAQLPYFPGVKVNPSGSTLEPGSSVTIAVTNTSTIVSIQNQIKFVPTNNDAGEPARVNYATQACSFSG